MNTSRPPVTRRDTSTLPQPICKIHPTATVADKAHLIGPHTISIGENSFIHPHAKLRAEFGDVTIGKGCIIAERAVVGLAQTSEEQRGVMIGDGVSVESSAVVEGRSVGEWGTLQIGSCVGKGAKVGRWCKIAALCGVRDGEELEDFEVVYGEGARRVDGMVRDVERVRTERMTLREKEIELLRTLVPDGSVKWRSSGG